LKSVFDQRYHSMVLICLICNIWRSGQRAAPQIYTSNPSVPRQSSDPSRKLIAKTLGYTYKLNRGISHDFAVNLRNKQSEIILLSKFLALTRYRRKITVSIRYPSEFCPLKFNSQLITLCNICVPIQIRESSICVAFNT